MIADGRGARRDDMGERGREGRRERSMMSEGRNGGNVRERERERESIHIYKFLCFRKTHFLPLLFSFSPSVSCSPIHLNTLHYRTHHPPTTHPLPTHHPPLPTHHPPTTTLVGVCKENQD